MNNESIKQLVDLCRASLCDLKLEVCRSGIVANIGATRGDVYKSTSVYLDYNDPDASTKLESCIKKVQ